jgi:hypothetical protein
MQPKIRTESKRVLAVASVLAVLLLAACIAPARGTGAGADVSSGAEASAATGVSAGTTEQATPAASDDSGGDSGDSDDSDNSRDDADDNDAGDDSDENEVYGTVDTLPAADAEGRMVGEWMVRTADGLQAFNVDATTELEMQGGAVAVGDCVKIETDAATGTVRSVEIEPASDCVALGGENPGSNAGSGSSGDDDGGTDDNGSDDNGADDSGGDD